MSDVISVGCKMPSGLHLDLIDVNGVRDRFATLKGSAYKRADTGGGYDPNASTGGFALTFGVDKTKFTQWLKANKDSDILKAGLIIYREADLESEAREKVATPEMFAALNAQDMKAAGVEAYNAAA